MEKYHILPMQLIYEGIAKSCHFHSPKAADIEDVLLTHESGYVQRLLNQTLSRAEERRIGFPQSRALTRRELIIAQGTIDGARHALAHGCALNVAGGTHHAYANRGEGFCLLNDQAVASNFLLDNHLAHRILIIDLDVHQGQGTAQIFENEPRVFTFSMHGKDNYPLVKERSDLDIPLPTGTTDNAYLEILETQLTTLFSSAVPDFVFYLAGADPLHTDKLGLLALTHEGLRQRDRMVLEVCHARGIPVQISMGGGYSPKLADIVQAHCNTFRIAMELWD